MMFCGVCISIERPDGDDAVSQSPYKHAQLARTVFKIITEKNVPAVIIISY